MKWYENWLEVFKIGTHTDSAGNTRAWTQEDLDTIVAKYDPKQQEAPVVLGHPKTDEPAYAWVSELRTQDGVLFAKLERVDSEFSLWVEKGLYRKISIALDADLNLRHIGFLGAANPAVKGLCNDFCDSSSTRLVVSELSFLNKMERRGVENPEGEDCLSAHSARVPQPSGMSLPSRRISVIAPEGSTALLKMRERELGGSFCGTFLKKFPCGAIFNKENNMFKKQSPKDFAAKAAELERELEFAAAANQRAEFGAFLGGLHAQAKITAEDKIGLEQVFETLLAVDAMGFSSSEESSNGASLSAFSDFLSALPPRVELKELATRENAPKGTYRTPQEELGMKIAKSI